MQTDLAAALQKVMTEIPADRLAGVLLLTDGRHNASAEVEPLARQLGIQRVPVCPIVFGSASRPTTDAAIIALHAPDTLFAKDKLLIRAELKLDGLAGKTVSINLFDGDDMVDSDQVEVKTDRFQTTAQLTDEPEATGIHRYRVVIEPDADEVLLTNNDAPLTLSVTDDQTKLLLLDGRPRWEFRYLKNLFASRDRSVKLQHLLFEPDHITGVPAPPQVHASASRPKEESEATALPATEDEWMKFDVIVLGDVDPARLGAEGQKVLRKFVSDRGGTLIVIAGPNHMPHAFAASPLAEILPVTLTAAAAASDSTPWRAPEKSFRIALTAEGEQSAIPRLVPDPQDNLKIWDSLPPIYWRHPAIEAKEAATVLAFALPPHPPKFLRSELVGPAAPPDPSQRPDTDADTELLRLRRDFERQHALLTLHHVAYGQVMFLSFDHTWRLRYRTGDPYHHRFWGQVLRWATAGKLPIGTPFVKLGTDHPRYPPQTSVFVRAKIVQPDYAPVISDDVAAKVFEGDRLLLRRKLDYVADSPGIYRADLGVLPGGQYRVELDAPAAEPILAKDGLATLAAPFSVEQATPAELVELAADRGFLARLATLTGGVLAEPHRAAEALGPLGPAIRIEREYQEFLLWTNWPLLVIMVLVAASEWLLRKKVRLP